MKKDCFNVETIYALRKLLERNKMFDFASTNLYDQKIVDRLQLFRFTDDVDLLVECLQGYQRLLHIWPAISRNVALRLLIHQIHSAVQIAYMGEESFLAKWDMIFGDNILLGKMIFLSSLSKRNMLMKSRYDLIH